MTTLPPFLVDTHKVYKDDTDRVVTWLAETAQTCGYPLALPPAGRLKGKARKLAREREKADGASSAAVRHTIPVNQFTDLADCIAKHKPIVKVPQVVLRLLDRAIALRKRCADWFQFQPATADVVSDNSKHSHFIGVLESVLQILHPKSASKSTDSAPQSNGAPPSTNSASKSDHELDKLANFYDILSIDDTDSIETPMTETATDNAASRKNTSAQPRKVIYEAEVTEEEVCFAMVCFFNDLHHLRMFLQNLWQQYHRGTLDLMTASVTTNTAINLVRRAEQDLFTTYPTLESYEKILMNLRGFLYETRGTDPILENLVLTDAGISVGEWLYLGPHETIKFYCSTIKKDTVMTVQRTDSIGEDPPKRSTREENLIILLEGLVGFFYLSQCDVPVLDELTDGLRSAFVDKVVPLWVAYASQIFLDIQNVLRENVGRGLSELQATGIQIASSLEEYRANTPVEVADWPSFSTHAMEHLSIFIEQWIPAPPADDSKHIALASSSSVPPEALPLFKRHPLLCGLFQFKLYTYLQYISLDLINAWGSVLYMGHLYEACRQRGYLKQMWPDMEVIMNFHSRVRMFAGCIPQTPAESFKCMQLTLGVSPVNFARTNRPFRMQISHKNRKKLSFESPLMKLFHKQWDENGDTILTTSTMEDLLMSQQSASSQQGPKGPAKDESWMLRSKDHKMTHMQFLDTLSKAISAEEHIFRFDYISLHVRCLHFLRELRTVLDPQLRYHFGPDYINDETQLCYVVYCIFKESAGFGKNEKDKPCSESSMLKQASEMMAAHIEREGSVECDKLEKRCLCWARNNVSE